MVREFQRVVGEEARRAVPTSCWAARPRRGGGLRRAAARTRPAPSPGSSTPPPGWSGSRRPAGAAATNGVPGVLHGMRSRLLQDEDGQILEAESISAGLDYPGIGPEHAHLARDRAGPSTARRPTTRCSTAFQPAGPDRGHHPGPRAGPRAGLGRRRGRPVDPGRVDRARHAVGAGRQGRGPGARPAGRPSRDAMSAARPRDRGRWRRRCGPARDAGPSCSSPTSWPA